MSSSQKPWRAVSAVYVAHVRPCPTDHEAREEAAWLLRKCGSGTRAEGRGCTQQPGSDSLERLLCVISGDVVGESFYLFYSASFLEGRGFCVQMRRRELKAESLIISVTQLLCERRHSRGSSLIYICHQRCGNVA